MLNLDSARGALREGGPHQLVLRQATPRRLAMWTETGGRPGIVWRKRVTLSRRSLRGCTSHET